jgi:hypothetical protein
MLEGFVNREEIIGRFEMKRTERRYTPYASPEGCKMGRNLTSLVRGAEFHSVTTTSLFCPQIDENALNSVIRGGRNLLRRQMIRTSIPGALLNSSGGE